MNENTGEVETMNRYERSHHEDMRAANRRSMRMWRRNLIVTLAVVAVIFTVTVFRGGEMKLEFGQEALVVTAPDHTATAVPYADIRGVTLYTDPDYGTCSEGQQTATCWYGLWQNAQWQRYRLCVHPKVNRCIAVEAADGVLAFNGVTAQDTAAIEASLKAILQVHAENVPS